MLVHLFCIVSVALVHPLQAQDSPQDFLDVHNAARAAAGVAPLIWNETVAAYAQDYASERAADCSLVHSDSEIYGYGENLARSFRDLSGKDAVMTWVEEQKYYNHTSNSCFAPSGGSRRHYTQVVWLDSIYWGCAKGSCYSGGTFITCNYSPRGNHAGQRPY